MSLLEDVANRVAAQTLELIEATGDEELEKKVAGEIGASSPTLQEAFTTALRILKAEARAQRYIKKVQENAGQVTSGDAPTVAPERKPEAAAEPEPVLMAVETPAEPEPEPEVEEEDEVIALPSPKPSAARRVTRLPKL